MTFNLEETLGTSKVYYGGTWDKLDLMRKEGKVLMSIAEIIQLRISILNSLEYDDRGFPIRESKHYNDFTEYCNGRFKTADGIAYHSDGERIKVVLNTEYFDKVNEETPVILGTIPVWSEEKYNACDGEEFSLSELIKFEGETPYRVITSWKQKVLEGRVKGHPLWNLLVPNSSCLDEYINLIFEKNNEWCREQHDKSAMSIDVGKYPSSAKRKGSPYLLRPFSMKGLLDGSGGSAVYTGGIGIRGSDWVGVDQDMSRRPRKAA